MLKWYIFPSLGRRIDHKTDASHLRWESWNIYLSKPPESLFVLISPKNIEKRLKNIENFSVIKK